MNGPVRDQSGLYDARFEHDACGVGFVADIKGRPTNEIVRRALTALSRLSHRGGINADGQSGDGAGIMTQIPRPFFTRVLSDADQSAADPGDIAVGVAFLPTDNDTRPVAIDTINDVLGELKLPIACWREVPIERSVLGREAAATCPNIHQFVILRPHGLDFEEFERELYRARKLVSAKLRGAGIEQVSIPSLSCRTIVYKGLMVAPQLAAFYPDLADPAFTSALAVFHQRFSTNTRPRWDLAQPFHRLAHNGEINTIQGNINRFNAAFEEMSGGVWGGKIRDLDPIIMPGVSDSAALDNVFELLTLSGREPLHAMMMLIPEAYQQNRTMPPDLGAFYEYHAALMAPWDGPAAIAFTDGRIVAAALDRNGLRPMRFWMCDDDMVIAGSETGLIDAPYSSVVKSGRLGPGQLLAVDVIGQRLLLDGEIKQQVSARRPYRSWVEGNMIRVQDVAPASRSDECVPRIADLVRMRKAFAYGTEDVERILEPMAYTGKEPVGSMGDDTPIVVLSEHPKTIYRYFKQIFAQVTNPPIDSLRERMVMSRRIALGSRGDLLSESDHATALVKFQSPIVTNSEYEWLMGFDDPRFRHHVVGAMFPVAHGPEGLEPALTRICAEVEKAVDQGCSLIVLSDRQVSEERAPIPMLLATASVHHHLIRARKRMRCSLICDTGDVRDTHHFACLLGYGAALIHPYLALAGLGDLVVRDPRHQGISLSDAVARYRQAVEDGVLKIIAKRGISTISGYRGAQVFEALGIAREVIDRHFTGTVSRIGGVRIADLGRDVLRFHAEAYGEDRQLADRGIYHHRRGGEFHASNPTMNKVLHKAVRNSDQREFMRYARMIDDRQPSQLRDLIRWKTAAKPLDINDVESAHKIALRFCSQAMSLGAISPEAHEALAVAMNRLGAKSNSGEGGEDSERYYVGHSNGRQTSLAVWRPGASDHRNSVVKQIASGRFGVTPEYLVSAEEIEIKMAQGAKPGEGGQIAGEKVSDYIAKLRNALPGTTLISPPPHHDIYSIEDLGQLIYDLKRINPTARVGVKLVSVAGVGTIAAGVVKANADCVHISGFDGGTGASALSSIKHAGLPWELGLAEVQQTLMLNQLRERVTLRVDGGLRTGRDVVVAALLGADEYGFGTAALVAAGCVMVRQCHLNTCPVGIATQRDELRAKFPGTPDHVVAMMLFIAEQVRLILAEIGFARLEDIIGRVDLLEARPDLNLPKTPSVDVSALLKDPDPSGKDPRRRAWHRNERREDGVPLDEIVWRECMSAIVNRAPIKRTFVITNRDRSVGARLAGEIARHTRSDGLPAGSIDLEFEGTSGQSFGAFCHRGMLLRLKGEAQDYVGKGMFGGTIVVAPPNDHIDAPVAMGNAVMYGATGGALFGRGSAGERFCVRNSGGWAVVEGCGDHGCEYMTNGIAVVLGDVGRNFAAGMTGGVAYIYDHRPGLSHRVHNESVELQMLRDPLDEDLLRALLERHHQVTQSPRADELLNCWKIARRRFSLVVSVLHTTDGFSRLAEIKEYALTELHGLKNEGVGV